MLNNGIHHFTFIVGHPCMYFLWSYCQRKLQNATCKVKTQDILQTIQYIYKNSTWLSTVYTYCFSPTHVNSKHCHDSNTTLERRGGCFAGKQLTRVTAVHTKATVVRKQQISTEHDSRIDTSNRNIIQFKFQTDDLLF